MTPQQTIEALYQQYLDDDKSTHPVSLLHAIWNAAIEASAESAEVQHDEGGCSECSLTGYIDKDSILKLLIK